MDIVSSLKEKYDVNNPIFIDEIRSTFKNYSKIRVAQLIEESIDKNEIIRFENGIYYIPTKTVLGNSTLSIAKVIEKKYIRNDTNIYGFYYGLSFLNYIDITTQVPQVYEIITNNESTRVRRIKIKNQDIILRKARFKITRENYKTLQFLEFINSTDMRFLVNNSKKINQYFNNNVDKKQLETYLIKYPSKTIKKLYELDLL